MGSASATASLQDNIAELRTRIEARALPVQTRVQTGKKRRELDPWMSTAEAAAHCGLQQDTIRAATAAREMTFRRETREKGRIYIRLTEVERWFSTRTIEERRL